MFTAPTPVEILHTPGWGRWQAARDAVHRAAKEEGIEISMEEITVSTRDEAETLRFPGSPTVRVHGRDLQPKAEEAADYGLG